MSLQETYTLPNGMEIPRLGLGTWFIKDDDAAQAVVNAVSIGYRHIDTAQAYGNERGVGEGIKACGVGREELFVTTKLAAEIKSYQGAVRAIDESLATLGLDHIDLMIIHSPWPWGEFKGTDRHFEGNREAWRALEGAYAAGKLRAIGVSNFEEPDIDNLLGSCTVKPMVNQIRAHIGSMPTALIEYSQAKGMLVEAYSPIGHGAVLGSGRVAEIAERYSASVPRLSIRYLLQLGLLPLPKTANPRHMKDNAQVDFVISEADMDLLNVISPITDYGAAGVFPVFREK